LGFKFDRVVDQVDFGPGETVVVAIPYWFIIFALLVVPAIDLRGFLHFRHRRKRGLCPTCGYDLRASPDRCPECGTMMELKTWNAA
jgi:hypothetical protein